MWLPAMPACTEWISQPAMSSASSTARCIDWYAEAIDKIYGEVAPTAPDILGLVHHAPVGVVAQLLVERE